MDFKNYIKTLTEEKKYTSKPKTFGSIVKQDSEKDITIPYQIAGILKKNGFVGKNLLFIRKFKHFLIKVSYNKEELIFVLCSYNVEENEITTLSEDSFKGFDGVSDWISDKVDSTKVLDDSIKMW